MIQYIELGSVISLETGKKKGKWLLASLFGFNDPTFDEFRIIEKGNRFGATMRVELENIQTNESKTIHVSHDRYFPFRVEEYL